MVGCPFIASLSHAMGGIRAPGEQFSRISKNYSLAFSYSSPIICGDILAGQVQKMRTRSFRLLAALGLLLCVVGSWAQSTDTATERSIETLKKQAASGDVKAQFILGMDYYEGHGVLQDYAQAVIWYRKAAEQGDAWAQVILGELYQNGQGVP